jgi:cytochrome c biogenesis protein CcdA
MKLKNILVVSVLVILVILFALSYTGIIHTGFIDVRSHVGFLPLVVALAAFLDSLNPCAFSVLFLTMAFLFSVGHNRRHIIKAGLAYVFGIFLTYVLIGLGTLKALTLFNITNGPAKIGAIAIIIFAIIMIINEFFPSFPIKLKIPESTHEKLGGLISKASIPSAFVLGFLVGMFEFPCAGGPYLFVLGMIHENSTHYVGIAYLLFYNLIFVLPLLIALFVVSDKIILERLDNLRRVKTKQVRVWTAIIFIMLGLLVFML